MCKTVVRSALPFFFFFSFFFLHGIPAIVISRTESSLHAPKKSDRFRFSALVNKISVVKIG